MPIELLNQFQQPSGYSWSFAQTFTTGRHEEPPVRWSRGTTCAEVGIIIRQESQKVLLRNNEVFVEGDENLPPDENSLDILIEADSTNRWDSDFNVLMRDFGNIGRFAGSLAVALPEWQGITNDDWISISPDPNFVWVDRDGEDDILGFGGVGLSDGRDDNFHLRSPYAHVKQGALAPAETADPELPPGWPIFQPVVWDPMTSTGIISPSIDWGDPAYDWSLEPDAPPLPFEDGQFIDVGTYGNTDQASSSEPFYVHMVWPIGYERLVYGREYGVTWRSHDYFDGVLDPSNLVAISLHHGGADGPMEALLSPSAPNTGSFPWTVPDSITPANDYVIVVTRSDGAAFGESRFSFSIGADAQPPFVLSATPLAVDCELCTNQEITSIKVNFSEGLLPATAVVAANYDLRSAGANGIFDDSDDVIVLLTRTYIAPSPSGATSTVNLASRALEAGDYRFTVVAFDETVLSGGVRDTSGLGLDGNRDGLPGDDYVRFFTVDFTPPTADIVDVALEPRNTPVDAVTIEFSERVREFGRADLRLTRDGGPNLLTGYQSLVSDDDVTWTLGNLAQLTTPDGEYSLQLASEWLAITNCAGNVIQLSASATLERSTFRAAAAGGDGAELSTSETWVMDTIPPQADIGAVAPDPRNASVDQITINFSETVWGFTLSDLSLTRDNGPNLLGGAQTIGTTDNQTFTLDGLSGLTTIGGAYALKRAASAVVDTAANARPGDVFEGFVVDFAPPTVDVIDVEPDPRNTAVDQISIRFSEPIFGFDLSDLTLSLDGGANLLSGRETLISFDNSVWTLAGLAGLTGASGLYTLAVADASVADAAGNIMAEGGSDSWLVEVIPPTADITDATPDPRRTSVQELTIVFSEPVAGFDLSDLQLTRDGGQNLLNVGQALTTTNSITWTLRGLSILTLLDGTYRLAIRAADSGITDLAGNALGADAIETFQVDRNPPTADILDVVDPRTSPIDQVTITFSESVAGFDASDISLRRDAGSNLLDGSQTLAVIDALTVTIGNLALGRGPGIHCVRAGYHGNSRSGAFGT